jgi:hypothetical protein
MDIQERVLKIEKRNQRVEMDKMWETSWPRRILIAVLTYVVIVLFFLVADLSRPFVNPIVPTVGFLLSTLTISFFKKRFIEKRK